VVLSSRESEARRSEPRSNPPPGNVFLFRIDMTGYTIASHICPFATAAPSSFADIMRTLVAPGSAIAPFDEMKEVNKDNYLRFDGKLGKVKTSSGLQGSPT